MTELEEFLKKQELENPENLKYILMFDEEPSEDQYGTILQRFNDPNDPEQYNLESWITYDDDEEPTLIFYVSPKAHQIFGEDNLISIYNDVVKYHEDEKEFNNAIQFIYENYEVH